MHSLHVVAKNNRLVIININNVVRFYITIISGQELKIILYDPEGMLYHKWSTERVFKGGMIDFLCIVFHVSDLWYSIQLVLPNVLYGKKGSSLLYDLFDFLIRKIVKS